jgi:hypothetical protein
MLSHSASSGSRHTGLPARLYQYAALLRFALFAMQIRMYPRTLDPFVLLRGLVRPVPIALRIPPQSGECGTEARRWIGRGERLAEVIEGHWVSSVAIGGSARLCYVPLAEAGEDRESGPLVKRAYAALYRAKQEGRNRVKRSE